MPPRSREFLAGSSRNVRLSFPTTPISPRSRESLAGSSSRNARLSFPTTPNTPRFRGPAAALSYNAKKQSVLKTLGRSRLGGSPAAFSHSAKQQSAPKTPGPPRPKTVVEWLSHYDKERQKTVDRSRRSIREMLEGEGTPLEKAFRLHASSGPGNRLYGIDIDYRNYLLSLQTPLRPQDTLNHNDPSPKRTRVPPSSPLIPESEPDAVAREPFPFDPEKLPDGIDDYLTSLDGPTQSYLSDLTPVPEIPSQLYIIQQLSVRLGGASSMTIDRRLRIAAFAEAFRQIEEAFYQIDPSLSRWFFSESETSYNYIYWIMCGWWRRNDSPYTKDQMRRILEVNDRVARLEWEVQTFGNDIGCFRLDGSFTHFSRSMSTGIICGRYGYDRIGEGMDMVDLDAQEPGDFEMPSEAGPSCYGPPILGNGELDGLLDTLGER